MNDQRPRLALHTWTLDTTPLADVLRIVQETGWDAVELRRKDFERAGAAGWSTEQVLDLVRASGVPVAAVGVEAGWLFATGAEQARLFGVFAASCPAAVALGCAGEEIYHVQFSDVPADAPRPGLDRLPPGQGRGRLPGPVRAAGREGLRGLPELRGAQPGRVGARSPRGRPRGTARPPCAAPRECVALLARRAPLRP